MKKKKKKKKKKKVYDWKIFANVLKPTCFTEKPKLYFN